MQQQQPTVIIITKQSKTKLRLVQITLTTNQDSLQKPQPLTKQPLTMPHLPLPLLLTLFLLLLLPYPTHPQPYTIAFILSNAHSQRMHNNEVLIQQRMRFQSTVYMNNYTRQLLANTEVLKSVGLLDDRRILEPGFRGSLEFQRTVVPQHFWVDGKQVILVEVDISKFPLNDSDKLKQYQGLFTHKGTSFYLLNSNNPTQTLPLQLTQLLNLPTPICRINTHTSTQPQLTAAITQCYHNSKKRTSMGKITPSIWYMLTQYGLVGLGYVVMTLVVAVGSPVVMVWWERRSVGLGSHV